MKKSVFFRISSVLMATILTIVQPCSANVNSCLELFYSKTKHIAGSRSDANSSSPSDPQDAIIAEFVEGLRNSKKVAKPPSQRKVKEIFESLSGHPLRVRQSDALLYTLLIHGADNPSDLPGHELLKQISKKNLTRVLNSKALPDGAASNSDRETALVGSLNVNFLHQSTNNHEKTKTPLLSAAIFAEMGIPEFASNTKEFPKSLGSDVHLSFDPFVSKKGTPGTARKGPYGHFSLTADPNYVSEVGWVTPYIMTERNLHRFAAITGVETFQNLHKFDFTKSDFEVLFKNGLYNALIELRLTNPSMYAHTMQILEGPSGSYEYDHMVQSLAWSYYGLPGLEFEARIPIAMPKKYYTVQKEDKE